MFESNSKMVVCGAGGSVVDGEQELVGLTTSQETSMQVDSITTSDATTGTSSSPLDMQRNVLIAHLAPLLNILLAGVESWTVDVR